MYVAMPHNNHTKNQGWKGKRKLTMGKKLIAVLGVVFVKTKLLCYETGQFMLVYAGVHEVLITLNYAGRCLLI